MSNRREIKQFVVGRKSAGADFDVAEIDALIHKLAFWFQSSLCDRNFADPIAKAKEQVKQCLLGERDDGEMWRNCPADFKARIKTKCSYDMVTEKGIPSPHVKKGQGRVTSELARAGVRMIGPMQPAISDFMQDEYRVQVEADILSAYPELDNPAHKPLVHTVSMYHAEREKIDRQLALGVNDSKRDLLLESLRKLAVMTESAFQQLGIHPNQVKKNIDKRTASSISDLVTQIEGDEDYRRREKVWALQLALQLWWMSEHPNGKKSGPQLSEFEIWHMTRSRPVKFTCRHGETYTVVEGFVPADLFALLIKEGVLVEEPVIPGLIAAKDLKGLSTHFAQDGPDADDGSIAERGVADLPTPGDEGTRG